MVRNDGCDQWCFKHYSRTLQWWCDNNFSQLRSWIQQSQDCQPGTFAIIDGYHQRFPTTTAILFFVPDVAYHPLAMVDDELILCYWLIADEIFLYPWLTDGNRWFCDHSCLLGGELLVMNGYEVLMLVRSSFPTFNHYTPNMCSGLPRCILVSEAVNVSVNPFP